MVNLRGAIPWLLALAPLGIAIVLSGLESKLLEMRVLNTKDMTFVGTDTGTITEHLLNIWHWDAAIFLMTVMGLISPFLVLTCFAIRRVRQRAI
jgi:hypothetical protein